jgi:ureidoacrylate peracid hydrolase
VLADSGELLSTLEQKVLPAHAALLVVDVQNDFVADGGFFDQVGADVKTIQRAIPPLAQLVDRAREAGVLVVFIQAIYDPQYLSAPMRERDLRVGRRMPRCLTGSWGADFHAIAPRPNEPVVIKHRYSAFANSELDDLLKRRVAACCSPESPPTLVSNRPDETLTSSTITSPW